MAVRDYKDLNIRYNGHPKYYSNRIIEDRIIEVILQKLEMILFTRKGEVIGQPNLGCDLEFYLWSTNAPADKIRKSILDQIAEFIPELTSMTYTVDIELYQGTVRDIMYVNITIQNFSVSFIFQ